MIRFAGPLACVASVACSGKGAESKVDPKAAVGFTRVLAAVASEEPTQSAAMLAQGAYETVARSEKCFEGFAAAATERARMEALLDCGLACTPDAVQKLKGVEPRAWMARLVAACEPGHFGLEKADTAMLSPEWFLLHKIGAIAAPHIEAATGADRAALDEAMGGFRLPLPLPAVASGLYELPVVAEEASVPLATRTYVVVSATGALRVGATPYATLGARGAAIAAPEGRALFPGNEAAKGDLRALVLDAAGAGDGEASPPPDAAPPPPDAAPARRGESKADLAKRQALDDARSAGVLGALSKMNSDSALGGAFGEIGEPPGLHGEVEETVRGDLGATGDPIPLLLADGERPAADVIEVAIELRRVLLAVSSAGDPAARALPVELEANLAFGGRSAGAATIVVRHGSVLDGATQAAETVVIEVADEAATWNEAAMAAAAAVERGAGRIVLTTSRMAGSGGGGGGLIGHGASGQGRPAVSLITDDAPTAVGDLDQGVIQRVMRSRMAAFRACYERELARKPALAGRVDLEFTIAADGAVSKVKGSGVPVVAECAARQVKALKFPPPKGGGVVKVRYPLSFKPKGE